jgi:hypothetical protein
MLAEGRWEEAQQYAERQLNLEPWREEAHEQLMLALAAGGLRSRALAQYQVCRKVLHTELGVQPGPALAVLYRRLRDGDQPRQRPAAGTAEVDHPSPQAQADNERCALLLAILADMARRIAQAGNPEQAIELLALVGHHPAANGATRRRVNRLLENVRRAVPPEVAAVAQARGRARPLEAAFFDIVRHA